MLFRSTETLFAGTVMYTDARYLMLGLLICLLGCTAEKPPAQAPAAPAVQPPVVVKPPPVTPSVSPPTPATSAQAASDIPEWAGKRADEPYDVKAFLASRAAAPDIAAPHYIAAFT